MTRLKTLTFLCAMMAVSLHARPWTANGKTIEAELVGYEPGKGLVWLQMTGKDKPFSVQLSILDSDSKNYVEKNEAGLEEYKGTMLTKAAKEKRENQELYAEVSSLVQRKVRKIVWDLREWDETFNRVSYDRSGFKPKYSPKPMSEDLNGLASMIAFPTVPDDLVFATYDARYQLDTDSLKLQEGGLGLDNSSATEKGELVFIYRKGDETKLFKEKQAGKGYVVFSGSLWKDDITVCPDKNLAYVISRILTGADMKIAKLQTEKGSASSGNLGKFANNFENAPYAFDPARVHSKRDDFEGYTSFRTDSAPAVKTAYGKCKIRMSAYKHDDNGAESISIVIGTDYTGEDWIFTKEVTLLGDNGERYSFSDNRQRRDVLDGGIVSEILSAVVQDKDVNLLESILLSGRVRVRFDCDGSSGYRVDWEMRGYQKRSCLDIINTYKQLKAANEKAKADAVPKTTQGKE